jgi:hypothetical protein
VTAEMVERAVLEASGFAVGIVWAKEVTDHLNAALAAAPQQENDDG